MPKLVFATIAIDLDALKHWRWQEARIDDAVPVHCMTMVETFADNSVDPPVRGFLHRPERPSSDALVLTHGAGGNAQMGLLIALAETFTGAGFTVLRCNLPFRQKRPFGPPRPTEAERDRAGLQNAIAAIKKNLPGRVFLGGQSYGGRQASILLAENQIADGMLLLSYPLHAPSRPDQPRTQHLPNLRVPTLFVQGNRDPFGTIEEIQAAQKLVPAKTGLIVVEGAGHDLGFKGKVSKGEPPNKILQAFLKLFG